MGKGIEPGMTEKTRQKLFTNQTDNQVEVESSLDSEVILSSRQNCQQRLGAGKLAGTEDITGIYFPRFYKHISLGLYLQ